MHARMHTRMTVASTEVLDRLCLLPPHTRAHTILCFIGDCDQKRACHTFVVWQGCWGRSPWGASLHNYSTFNLSMAADARLLRTHWSATWCSLSMFHFPNVARAPPAYRISGCLSKTDKSFTFGWKMMMMNDSWRCDGGLSVCFHFSAAASLLSRVCGIGHV